MTVAFMAVVVASLLVAASTATIALRHVRDSRARVQALRQLAFAGESPVVASDGALDRFRRYEPIRETTAAASTPRMFAAVEEPAPPARRWVSVAAVSGVMLSVIAVVFLLNDRVAAPGDAVAAPAAPPAVAAPPPAPVSASVELLSIRHEFDQGALTITGRVRNAPAARTPTGLVSVITLFDVSGRQISRREAPVAPANLAANGESAFTTAVAGARGVARYEVAFRSADGRTVTHVDKR